MIFKVASNPSHSRILLFSVLFLHGRLGLNTNGSSFAMFLRLRTDHALTNFHLISCLTLLPPFWLLWHCSQHEAQLLDQPHALHNDRWHFSLLISWLPTMALFPTPLHPKVLLSACVSVSDIYFAVLPFVLTTMNCEHQLWYAFRSILFLSFICCHGISVYLHFLTLQIGDSSFANGAVYVPAATCNDKTTCDNIIHLFSNLLSKPISF